MRVSFSFEFKKRSISTSLYPQVARTKDDNRMNKSKLKFIHAGVDR